MPSSGGGLKSNQKISGYPYDIYDNTASGDRPYQAGLFGISQSSKMGKMTIASSFLVECRGPSSAVKAILYRWTFQDSAGLVSPDCVTTYMVPWLTGFCYQSLEGQQEYWQ